ncbi:hypothetical protein HDU76_010249 [Blyttiomyces sp. JEL0837]|nr:hypothetical protein HDU76_010249 [Blyttiomyces sp. JEL0837]
MDSIEARLSFLESLASPFPIAQSVRPGTESVLMSLQSMQAKLRQITEERRPLADFLQRYSQLRDLIDNKGNELEVSALDAASKKEIVLASEDEILNAVDMLKEIDSLKDEVDMPVLEGFEDRILALKPIEREQIAQTNATLLLREEFTKIIDQYNQYITSLSQIFLQYDALLSSIERQALGERKG